MRPSPPHLTAPPHMSTFGYGLKLSVTGYSCLNPTGTLPSLHTFTPCSGPTLLPMIHLLYTFISLTGPGQAPLPMQTSSGSIRTWTPMPLHPLHHSSSSSAPPYGRKSSQITHPPTTPPTSHAHP